MRRSAIRSAVALISLLLALMAHESPADTPSPRIVLGPGAKGMVVGPGMNAMGRDLRGCEFVGQDLSSARFDGCNLYNVRIEDCILKRASFRGAIFTGAQVGGLAVDGLADADFTDAVINENGIMEDQLIFNFELSPKQLMSTRSYKTKDLHQCVISGAMTDPRFDFRGANLSHARIIDGDFSNCDFTNARVYRTTFGNISLRFLQLASTADFKGRGLRVRILGGGTNAAGLTGECDFLGIDLDGSEFCGLAASARLTDAFINGCTLRGGLTKAQLYSTRSYKDGNLTRASWVRIDVSGFDLAGANLTGSGFEQCDFTGASLEDAVITDVNFLSLGHTPPNVRWELKGETKGLTLEQIKSTWNYKHGRMAGIVLPKDIAEALKKQ